MEYNKPGYSVRWETGRWSMYMYIGASSRVMKFEVKIAMCKEGSIRKECWQKWAEVRGLASGMGKSRKKMIKARGSTRKEWKMLVESYEETLIWLERKEMEMEVEHGERKIKESRYVRKQSRML